MQEIINNIPVSSDADFLLDTCFFIHIFQKEKVKDLVLFCKDNKVGMSSFNLSEILNIHHKLKGNVNHQIRDFLKKGIIFNILVSAKPGDWESERKYVNTIDENLLKLVCDPSDAVLLALAININANVLTRDKHHLFTVAVENYCDKINIRILNDLC